MIGKKGPALSIAITTTVLVMACAPEPAQNTVNDDYAVYCASCHGASGRGDGPASGGMEPKPSDLTLITQRNGGTFPRLQIIGKIHGYTMGSSDRTMPEFAEALDSPPVPYDTGDGTPSPMPERLVELANYLESIQAQ